MRRKRNMLSSLWTNINFWNEYGEACEGLSEEELKRISEEKGIDLQEAAKLVEDELKKVKRIVIEAGRDMSEDEWVEVAIIAKKQFGMEAVLDISIRKNLLGGARVVVDGNVTDNTVINRYMKWRGV